MSNGNTSKATSEEIARLRASITATVYALAEVRKQLVERTGILDLEAYQVFRNVAQPDFSSVYHSETGLAATLGALPSGGDVIRIDKWIDWANAAFGWINKLKGLIDTGKNYLTAVINFFGAIATIESAHTSLKRFERELLDKLAGYEAQLAALLAQEQNDLNNRREQANRSLAAGEVVLYEANNFGGDVTIGQEYITDVEIDANSLRIAADTGVTIYADECLSGESQEIPVSVPTLAGSKLNGLHPRSVKTWPLQEKPYTGKWAVKIVRAAAQGNAGPLTDDLFLSVKTGQDNVGVLTVSRVVAERETFGVRQLSGLNNGRQQVSFELSGVSFVPASRSKKVWSMPFDPLHKITLVAEKGYRCFSLMTEQKKWVRYSNDNDRVFYPNDYYDERTIFTFALRIAESETQLGALDAGEIALYENPIYWGRVWVLNSTFLDFDAIPSLANRISSIRLGATTAATLYREDATTTPPTLVREDITTNVHDMRLSQIGDDAITAIRPWRMADAADYDVRHSSVLSQDYEPDATGTKAADITVYRTTIEVPLTVGMIRLWTTDTATITIGGVAYETDEDHAAEITPNAGRVVVTMKAAKLTAPALKLQLDSMSADERIVIHADRSAHDRLLALDAVALEQAKDSQGRNLIPSPQDDRIPRSAVAEVIVGVVQATIPPVAASNGATTAVSSAAETGKTYRLSFAEGSSPTFSVVATETLAASASINAVSDFFDDLFNDITDWTTESFEEVKKWIEQGAEFLITQVTNGVQVLIKGFENEVLKPLKEFVLTSAQAVAEFVEMVIEKIGVIIEEFVRWLRLIFNWDNFLTTQETLKNMFNYGLDKLTDLVKSAKAPVQGFFNDTRQLVTNEIDQLIINLGGNPQADPATNPISFEMPDLPDFTWLLDKIVSAFKEAGINLPNPDLSPELEAQLTALIDSINQAFEEIGGAFVEVGQSLLSLLIDPNTGKPINPTVYVEKPQIFAVKVLEIIKDIANGGLTAAEKLIEIVLEAVATVVVVLKEILNGEIKIPFIADLFKTLTKNKLDLSLINVGTLLIAIPVTLVYGGPVRYDLAQSDNGFAAFDAARRPADRTSATLMASSAEMISAPMSAASTQALNPPEDVVKAMKSINICAALAEATINAILNTLTLPEGVEAGAEGVPSWTNKIAPNPAKGLEITSFVLAVIAWGADAPSGIFMVPHVHTFGKAGKDDGSSDYWENVVWFYEAGGLVLDLFSLTFSDERVRRADILGVVLSTVYSSTQLALVSTLTAKRRDSGDQAGNYEKFMGVWPGFASWLRIKELAIQSVGISLVVLATLDGLAGLSTFGTGIADLAS